MANPPAWQCSTEEYDRRRQRVREAMARRGLDACLIASPENIYYLCGLDHMGYFAYQALILPREDRPILVTRAMERATVADQAPDVRHVGYSDGSEPAPLPSGEERSAVLDALPEGREVATLEPWSTSLGVVTREPKGDVKAVSAAVRETVRALREAGLERGRLGIEKSSTFLPYATAEGIVEELPEAAWEDASGLVDDCRIAQSPGELSCTRQAAAISDSMMLSAIAAAGPGVNTREVMAAIYDAMFRRGGTYPGFVPLVRSTRTLAHEHGT